jgi:hypothetical protein
MATGPEVTVVRPFFFAQSVQYVVFGFSRTGARIGALQKGSPMKHIVLLALVSVCLAPPALAQSRVYTNADLGKPLNRTHSPTADEMQGLIARQFSLSGVRHDEPQVVVLPYDPVWPFTYSQRLELDPWRMPGGSPLYGPWGPAGYWYNPFVIHTKPFGWYQTAPRSGHAPSGASWRAPMGVAPAAAAARSHSPQRGGFGPVAGR